MNQTPDLIRIAGDRATLAQLLSVADLEVLEHSDEDLGGGQFSVFGYATPAATVAVAALGATATVVQSGAEIDAQLQIVGAQVTDQPLGGGGVA